MGKFSNLLISATLLVSFISHHASGYGGGADPSVCDNMIPGHGPPPQTSESPYKITLSKTALKGFETVNITLDSKNGNDIFKGFLIQVRKPGDGNKIVGEFSKDVADPNARTLNCFKQQRSAMTHKSPVEKKSVTVEWIAPNEEDAEYQVYYSAVGANGGTYWTAVTHPEKLRVTRDTQVTTTVASVKAASVAQLGRWREIYEGCGDTKGCFGMPGNCVSEFDASSSSPRLCQMIVTWAKEGEKNNFQLSGVVDGSSGYVALGISSDSSMGADSVVGCVSDGSNSHIKRYHNTGKNNQIHSIDQEGIIDPNIVSEDGHVFCSFEQRNHKIADNVDINFDTNSYHYLLSRAASFSSGGLGQHDADDKVASPDAVNIAENTVMGASSNTWLIQLHGGLMVIAWLMCASTGMFTARYYKHTHTDFTPLGKAFWFALHVFCMSATAFLTICGAIFIVIYKKGLEFKEKGAHPILGCIVIGLAICQVVIALFRPHPNTKFRPLFNWIHWGIGNSAHIIGIACIFLAWDLSLANLKRFGDDFLWMWIMMAIVLFHVLMHIVMSIHTLWADSQLDTSSNKKRAVFPGPMKPNGMSTDAPGSAFRTFMLSLYLVVMAAGAITLVLLVFWPKESTDVEINTTEPTS